MAAFFSLEVIESQIEKLNIPEYIKFRIKKADTNISKLETTLNTKSGFLNRVLKRKDPVVSILVTLSMQLQYNLLEPILELLPEHIRQTRKEKQLQEEIDNLKKELEIMTAQRDLLVKVASRG
jgi:hypothetical protein